MPIQTMSEFVDATLANAAKQEVLTNQNSFSDALRGFVSGNTNYDPTSGEFYNPKDAVSMADFTNSLYGTENPITRGFLNATGIPQLITGKAIETSDKLTTSDKVGEFVGQGAELGLELFGIGKLLVTKGILPLGKALFPSLVEGGLAFGVQEATRQVRLGTAEAIHGTDVGYSGGAGVASAVGLGALLGGAGYIAKSIWSALRPAEQVAARKALGLAKDAGIDEINAAYAKQRAIWDPAMWVGNPMVNQQTADAVKQRFARLMITRNAALKEVIGDVVPSRTARAAAKAVKPIITEPITGDILTTEIAKHTSKIGFLAERGSVSQVASGKLPAELEKTISAPFSSNGLQPSTIYALANRGIHNTSSLITSGKEALSGLSDETLGDINSLVTKTLGKPLASPEELLLISNTPTGESANMLSRAGVGKAASNYIATVAGDTGLPALPDDPILAAAKITTLKQDAKLQTRINAGLASKVAKGTKFESINKLNHWTASRYMIADFDERYGIPISHVWDRTIENGAMADSGAVKFMRSVVSPGDLATMTAKDNVDILHYLASPKTRLEAEKTISDHALDVAKRMESVLQGRAGLDIQQAVFYRWAETGVMPSDIWRAAADQVLASDKAVTVKDINGVNKLVQSLAKRGGTKLLKQPDELIAKLTNKYEWTPEQAKTVKTFLTDEATAQAIKDAKGYPKRILEEGKKAWEAKKLPEWIAQQPPWGRRRFYYMTDFAKNDLIDEFTGRVGLSALESGQPNTVLPGTMAYESHARRSIEPMFKSGSVVHNILDHVRKLEIYNAVHDDMKVLASRLNQVALSDSDRTGVQNVFKNLLHKRMETDPVFGIAAKMKGWYWKTSMSIFMRPATVAWRMVRDAGQSALYLGTGGVKNFAKSELAGTVEMIARTTGLKPLERYDPVMMKNYLESFIGYQSQRSPMFYQAAMVEAADISKDFRWPRLARRVSNLIEQGGKVYPYVDELKRSGIWIAEYDSTKKAATKYVGSKRTASDFKDFFYKVRMSGLSSSQKRSVIDLLGAGKIDDLAKGQANYVANEIMGRFRTAERSVAEQTIAGRTILGMYNFPRGYVELWYRRGLRPLFRGDYVNNDLKQSWRGVSGLLKIFAATTAASEFYKATLGQRVYDLTSELGSFTGVDPGIGQLLQPMAETAHQIALAQQGKQELTKAIDNSAAAWVNQFETMAIPLSSEIESIYESENDVAGVTIYRAIRNQLFEQLNVKPKDYAKTERDDMQKLVHMLTGKFERVPKEAGPTSEAEKAKKRAIDYYRR